MYSGHTDIPCVEKRRKMWKWEKLCVIRVKKKFEEMKSRTWDALMDLMRLSTWLNRLSKKLSECYAVCVRNKPIKLKQSGVLPIKAQSQLPQPHFPRPTHLSNAELPLTAAWPRSSSSSSTCLIQSLYTHTFLSLFCQSIFSLHTKCKR